METEVDRWRLGWSCGRVCPLSLKVISHGRIGRVFCSLSLGVLEYSQDLMQKKRAAPNVSALAFSLGREEDLRTVLHTSGGRAF